MNRSAWKQWHHMHCFLRFIFTGYLQKYTASHHTNTLLKKGLEKAKELLKSGQLSVAGICTGIGFESHGSFSVLFKKYHGIAPKSYQTKAVQLQQKAKEQPRFVIPSCFLPPDPPEKK